MEEIASHRAALKEALVSERFLEIARAANSSDDIETALIEEVGRLGLPILIETVKKAPFGTHKVQFIIEGQGFSESLSFEV